MKSDCLTPHQAKYLAARFKIRYPVDHPGRYLATFYDADIQFHPHQYAAIEKIGKTPLVDGGLLADEFGLGKTIEAGLVITHRVSDGVGKVLLVVPVMDRYRWKRDLLEKFSLQSKVIDNKGKMTQTKLQELIKDKGIYICSYKFAFKNVRTMMREDWGLVLFDEAHRLKNIYGIRNDMGDMLSVAFGKFPMLILTSNPLQSSNKRLFKLINMIDRYTFGDMRSFNHLYANSSKDINMNELRERLEPIVHRSKLSRIREFGGNAKKVEVKQLYSSSPVEKDFYSGMVNYFINASKYGLPSDRESIGALGLFKQLILSPKLAMHGLNIIDEGLQKLKEGKDAHIEIKKRFMEDIETLRWTDEEWYRRVEPTVKDSIESKFVKRAIDQERKSLLLIREYALAAQSDSRVEALFKGLERAKKKSKKTKPRCVIYTESVEATRYLKFILQFNGYKNVYRLTENNTDSDSLQLYEKYALLDEGERLSGNEAVDMRSAILHAFKTDGEILITTDNGMQDQVVEDCDILINYDLPINPYVVQKRISSLLGYVNNSKLVILNIINKTNELEYWNYQQLATLFNLFSGKFGRSDIPVGAIGVGADYEMEVFGYYMRHHTIELVERSYKRVRIEVKDSLSKFINTLYTEIMEDTLDKEKKSWSHLSRYYRSALSEIKSDLLDLACFYLQSKEKINTRGVGSLNVDKKPFRMRNNLLGEYFLDDVKREGRRKLYLQKGFGKLLIDSAFKQKLPRKTLRFQYSSQNAKSLKKLKGKKGVLNLKLITVKGVQNEQYLLFSGIAENGVILTQEQARELMKLKAEVVGSLRSKVDLTTIFNENKQFLLNELIERDSGYLRDFTEKLRKWADDRILIHKKDLRLIMIQKRKLHRRWINAVNDKKRRRYESELLEVGVLRRKKMRHIRKVRQASTAEMALQLKRFEGKMKYKVKSEELFTIGWELK